MGLDAKKYLLEYNKNPVARSLSVAEAVDIIIENHMRTDGATVSLSFGNMIGTPYYSVSIFPDLSKTISGKEIDRNELVKFIQAHERLARSKNIGIGTW